MPALADLQRGVLWDLSGLRPRDARTRQTLFRQPPAGTLEDRWRVYSEGYQARLAESLENDFPAVRRVLGDGPFRSLSARYVRVHPPRSFDLGRAGERLASFLARDPLSRQLPFLAELAQLEWALAEAVVAREVPLLRWQTLAARGAEAVADIALALAPGVLLIRSRWPLFDLWMLREAPPGQASLQVEGRPQTVVGWRRRQQPACRTLDEPEATLIEAAARGESLARLLHGAQSAGWIGALLERFPRLVALGLFASRFEEEEEVCK